LFSHSSKYTKFDKNSLQGAPHPCKGAINVQISLRTAGEQGGVQAEMPLLSLSVLERTLIIFQKTSATKRQTLATPKQRALEPIGGPVGKSTPTKQYVWIFLTKGFNSKRNLIIYAI
jgi:hypothetical protein